MRFDITSSPDATTMLDIAMENPPTSTDNRRFPRAHALALALLTGGLTWISLLPNTDAALAGVAPAPQLQPSARDQITEELLPAERLPATTSGLELEIDDVFEDLSATDSPIDEPEPPAALASTDPLGREIVVRPGDSLAKLFQREGIAAADLHTLTRTGSAGKQLARLRPNERLTVAVDADGQLQRLERARNRLETEIFTRAGNGFTYRLETAAPDVQTVVKSAEINSSLYHAGTAVGMPDKIIMELAGIFGWDIDFALDIRKGDSFTLLYEERSVDGHVLGSGDILAAEFTNRGVTYRTVRYVDAEGRVNYYTPEGKSMRKAFLRAPVDFRRISSNFNPRRLHPITKTVKPHRGIDYAADRGTPVWAAGDGHVIAAGYTAPNGNYVVLQHGDNVQTKYLHLHQRMVKRGDRVRQKDVIGTVGNTGYSTAPHLHYEFLLEGVHRDPRTILDKLPKAQSIAQSELARFYAQTQPLLAELSRTVQMASLKP